MAGVVDELEADIVRLDIAAQSRPAERPGSASATSATSATSVAPVAPVARAAGE
jgi:hypothetical protein